MSVCGLLGLIFAGFLSSPAASLSAQSIWPDLAKPAAAVGGGANDAALVVAIENYAFLPPVPGAEAVAKAWQDYFTATLGVPARNVQFLAGADATREEMLAAAAKAAAAADSKGAVWFVFVGHGALSADGQDRLLLAMDARKKSSDLKSRAAKRREIMTALRQTRAGAIRVIVDACRTDLGEPGGAAAPQGPAHPLTDRRVSILSAPLDSPCSGVLPGAARPAFSYLVLGGLRGWAGTSALTAGNLLRYAATALAAAAPGSVQAPELRGREEAAMGAPAGEKGPDLAALIKEPAPASAPAGPREDAFSVSSLPDVPTPWLPKAFDASAVRLDFRALDRASLDEYNEAFEVDQDMRTAVEDKAATWRALAKDVPRYAEAAAKRAAEWDEYAAQRKAAAEAARRRLDARDADWDKLAHVLTLGVVPEADKTRWSAEFATAYGKAPGLEPEMAKGLLPHIAVDAGGMRAALEKAAALARPGGQSRGAAKAAQDAGQAGIEWVLIPGGTFMMGAADLAAPVHSVTVRSFRMAKTLVTNKQYRACVAAGACTATAGYGDKFKGDDQPVVGVDWNQARTFSEWAGGRLPSEAEWEYAARGAGQARKYPWGDDEPTCERTVMNQGGMGCGRDATAPVCSKPAGNTEQGLCDMAGDVWQWTQDWYHDSYIGAPATDAAWESPEGTYRVARGGSWNYDVAWLFRSAYRSFYYPALQFQYLGFRPVRGH